MEEVVQAGQYPNPSAVKRWTDHVGRSWHLRGKRGEALDDKRARRLLRNDDVPLVTWRYGEVTWIEGSDQKQAAADQLAHSATRSAVADVFPTEWRTDEGDHLLMLEYRA